MWDAGRFPIKGSSPGPTVDRRSFCAGIGSAALTIAAAPAAASISGKLLLSSFRDLNAAIDAWSLRGGTLLVDRDAVLTRPATADFRKGLSYRLETTRPRTIRYAGPRFHWAICLLSRGENPLEIVGPLTIDGESRISMPFFVRFELVEGAARRDCLIDGLTVQRARMEAGRSPVDGSQTNAYNAAGIAVSGGFERLTIRNVQVHDITRAPGAGRQGSQGCVGICVTGGGLANSRHVTVEDFVVDTVDSEDPITSRVRGDMDGVLVFQGAEKGATGPVIQRGTITNAAGRAVKMFAPGGGGLTQDLVIARSRPGGPYGSVDIAHQHGEGTVRRITLRYGGSAHHNGTTVVGFSSGTKREPGYPFGPAVCEDIVIEDRTGADKTALFGLQYNVAGDTRPRSFRAARISDDGVSRYLFLPGALGTDQAATLAFSAVSVRLTTAVLASEDSNRRMTLELTDNRFTSPDMRPIPIKVAYNGKAVPKTLEVRPIRRGTNLGIAMSAGE